MFCHKCGSEIPKSAGFCHKCGAKIADGERMLHHNEVQQPTVTSFPLASTEGNHQYNHMKNEHPPKHFETVNEAKAKYDQLNKEQKQLNSSVALYCLIGALAVFGVASFVQFLGDSSMFNMEYSLPRFSFVDTDRRYTGRTFLVNFALANILFVAFWGGWLLTVGLFLFGIFSCYFTFVDISRNDVERKRTEAKDIREKDQDKAIKLEQEANELEAVLNALGK